MVTLLMFIFQTDDFDDHFYGKGESPAEAAGKLMGDNGEKYHEAKKSGGQLELKLSDYIESVAGTEDSMQD